MCISIMFTRVLRVSLSCAWWWNKSDFVTIDSNLPSTWKLKPHELSAEVAGAALPPVKISFSFLESIATHMAAPAHSTASGKSTGMPSPKGYISPFPQHTCKGILHNLTPLIALATSCSKWLKRHVWTVHNGNSYHLITLIKVSIGETVIRWKDVMTE